MAPPWIRAYLYEVVSGEWDASYAVKIQIILAGGVECILADSIELKQLTCLNALTYHEMPIRKFDFCNKEPAVNFLVRIVF